MKNFKNLLRIVTITLLVQAAWAGHVFSFDLDMTVEDDIRKNYNSSQLVKDTNTADLEELPALPANLQNGKTTFDTKKSQNTSVPKTQIYSTGNIKISKGTSFDVVNTTKISDWQTKGAVVKFKTKSPVYKKKYTLPAGTVFTGEIIESHQPQVSCNGGLVIIRVRSVIYGGKTYNLNAYITRADDKIIFLNNIKGERTYLKTMWKKGNWGRALFSRMLTLTVNLGGEGSTFLLSPFPFMYGTICFGANTLISPVTAFFQKGKHVSISEGSRFKIKLLEDAYID